MISTATIRTNNIKERKEKKNREKLLAGPGSEFSLANPEDLELDYYDYNVTNAGAAPGSYLGMDPAYLVWIPPLDDGMIIDETTENDVNHDDTDGLEETEEEEDSDDEDEEPVYEKILPNYKQINPGSNTETPDDEAPPLPPFNNSKSGVDVHHAEQNKNSLNSDLNKIAAADTFNGNSAKLNLNRKSSKYLNNVLTGHKSSIDTIQMQELSPKRNNYRLSSLATSPVKVHSQHRYNTSHNNSRNNRNSNETKDNDSEKETAVVKSPSDNINQYYELDDIQFADEESDEDQNVFINNGQRASSMRIGQCDTVNKYMSK